MGDSANAGIAVRGQIDGAHSKATGRLHSQKTLHNPSRAGMDPDSPYLSKIFGSEAVCGVSAGKGREWKHTGIL